jgi:hypothetical protein
MGTLEELEELEVMAVRFSGQHPDTGELMPIGALLLHPSGDALVLGPNDEMTTDVVLHCFHAADSICQKLPDDAPEDQRTLQFAIRAVIYQILDRIGELDQAPAGETIN